MHTLNILQIYIQIVFVLLWCQEGSFFISLAKLNMGKNCHLQIFFCSSDLSYFLPILTCFLIPIVFFNLNYNFCFVLDLRNKLKMVFCYQNCSDLLWEKTVNCRKSLKSILTFSCLNNFFLCSPKICKFSAYTLEFQKILRSLGQFFLTTGQNRPRSKQFWKKIPLLNTF